MDSAAAGDAQELLSQIIRLKRSKHHSGERLRWEARALRKIDLIARAQFRSTLSEPAIEAVKREALRLLCDRTLSELEGIVSPGIFIAELLQKARHALSHAIDLRPVNDLIKYLNDDDYRLFVLRFDQGLSFTEIAEIVSLPVSDVSKRLFGILHRLRDLFERQIC